MPGWLPGLLLMRYCAPVQRVLICELRGPPILHIVLGLPTYQAHTECLNVCPEHNYSVDNLDFVLREECYLIFVIELACHNVTTAQDGPSS